MNQNAARVLVTGGCGFIGSEVVAQLSAKGYHVTVVDNLVNGRRENLTGTSPELVTLEVADIRDSDRIQKLVCGVETVYHLACLGVRHSIHAPRENHEVNATATLELLAAARAAQVKRFVYVSSSEVYGTARQVPMTEEHPTLPHTVYGGSKLAGECYARAYYDTYKFPTIVVRPFNTYGPRSHHEGDSGEVIPKFLLRAMAGKPMVIFGDGSQTRDFTFVSDTADGIIRAGQSEEAIGKTINLGSGSELSILDLSKKVAKLLGQSTPNVIHDDGRPGDVLRLLADSSRAKRMLAFAPRVSLDEGLGQLHQWYLESGKSVDDLLKQELVHNWKA